MSERESGKEGSQGDINDDIFMEAIRVGVHKKVET